MTFCLDAKIIKPVGKNINNAVILLHGYGGDGNDIAALSINWKRFLPNTLFICPNGPEKCSINPTGYQWFDLNTEDEKFIMSINVGLSDKEKFEGVIGFSGKIINRSDLSNRILSKPSTLLIHGDQDEIVPPVNLLEAKDFFERNKIDITTKMLKGCGHNIPVEASSLGLTFLKKIFNINY